MHRAGALVLAVGLALSFTVIGLFVATVGFAIGLDGGVVRAASAVLLLVIGLVLLSGALQTRFAAASGGVSDMGNRLLAPDHPARHRRPVRSGRRAGCGLEPLRRPDARRRLRAGRPAGKTCRRWPL